MPILKLNKLYLLLIIASVFILVLSCLILILSKHRYQNEQYETLTTAQDSENLTSGPISYAKTNTSSNEISIHLDLKDRLVNHFLLSYLYLDNNEPSGRTLAIDLHDELKVTRSTQNRLVSEDKNWGIVFLSTSEEVMGTSENLIETTLIKNNSLDKKLYRIEAESFFKDEIMQNFSNEYLNYYYYTTEYYPYSECNYIQSIDSFGSCGSLYIDIEEYGFRVYCGANNDFGLLQCDKYLGNLSGIVLDENLIEIYHPSILEDHSFWSKSIIKINYDKEFFEVQKYPLSFTFNGPNIKAVFSATTEMFPGILNSIPEHKSIYLPYLDKTIYRTRAEEASIKKDLEKILGNEYEQVYYYGNSPIQSEDTCETIDSNNGCYNPDFIVNIKDNNPSFGFYCGINDVDLVTECDDLIKNITIQKFEILN